MIVFKVFISVILTTLVIRLFLESTRWCRYMRVVLQTDGPSPWFILRNCVHITYRTLSAINELCRTYNNKPFRVFSLGDVVFLLSDPDDVSIVMKNSHLSDKPDFFYRGLETYFAKNILTGNGDFWNRCRRSVNPGFHIQALRSYIPSFNKGAQKLVEEMRPHCNGEEFIMLTIALKYVSGTNLQLVLGQQLEPKTLSLLDDLVKWGLYYGHVGNVNPIFFLYNRVQTVYKTFVVEAAKMMCERFQNIIKRKEEFNSFLCSTELTSVKPCSVIEHMVFKYRNTGENLPLSDDELATQVMAVGVRAYETSSTTITLILAMLALHPETQRKVREEMSSIFSGSDRPATEEDLKRMEQLERVIKEVLRLYPAVPLIGRMAKQDVDFNGTIVPKGSVIIVNIMSLHRNARVFNNPDQFDPDRFLPENVRDIPPFSYIPFSAGHRNCVGSRFAMTQLKIFTSSVVRNFELFPGEGLSLENIEIEVYFTMRLLKPITLRVISSKC